MLIRPNNRRSPYLSLAPRFFLAFFASHVNSSMPHVVASLHARRKPEQEIHASSFDLMKTLHCPLMTSNHDAAASCGQRLSQVSCLRSQFQPATSLMQCVSAD